MFQQQKIEFKQKTKKKLKLMKQCEAMVNQISDLKEKTFKAKEEWLKRKKMETVLRDKISKISHLRKNQEKALVTEFSLS